MSEAAAVGIEDFGRTVPDRVRVRTSPRLFYWPVLKPFLSWGFCFFWVPVAIAIWIVNLGLSPWIALAVPVALAMLAYSWCNLEVLLAFLILRRFPLQMVVSERGLEATYRGEQFRVALSDIASVEGMIVTEGTAMGAIIRLKPSVRGKIGGRWARWVELEPAQQAPHISLGSSWFSSDDTLDQVLKVFCDLGVSISEKRIERLDVLPANPPKFRFLIYAGFFNALAVASLIANLVNG